MPVPTKLPWSGTIVSAQPRIQLLRSFDERTHGYLGFLLRIRGVMGDEEGEFVVGIGKAAQAKHGFRVGDVVKGQSVPVADPRKDPAEYFKTSALAVIERRAQPDAVPPPWEGAPPDLGVYRERGHRRLSARTYESKCISCMWACRMTVEMTIDHWNPSQKRYRVETFCYGPKSCAFYSPGPTRKVPGRGGMTYEEEDWVDEGETAHRED